MPRKRYTFYIEAEQAKALKAIKARDGVLESEQIRRALDDWIAKKDVKTQSSRSTHTRKRP